MTDAKHRRLYLVRHGEAKPKDEDPERGLTEVGHSNVRRMAGWAAASGIVVDEIRHSGKLRAKQTAEIFAETLGMQAQLRSDDGQRIGFEAIGLNGGSSKDINMKRLLLITIALLLVTSQAFAESRPNILFIFADDWGWGDLSCHGHPYVKTPNIDRLAMEGTDFHLARPSGDLFSQERASIEASRN